MKSTGFFGLLGQLLDFLASTPPEVTVVIGPFGEPFLVTPLLVDDPELNGAPAALRRGRP
jgi:hypothetical protein